MTRSLKSLSMHLSVLAVTVAVATGFVCRMGGGETFRPIASSSMAISTSNVIKAAALTTLAMASSSSSNPPGGVGGATNDVIKTVHGIKHKRMGGGDIFVSELGLGTQRWVSEDKNAPQEAECFKMMDEAILNNGISLIDTASQYPIPSSRSRPEGSCEETIGKWMAQDKSRRAKVVIATKLVGSSNVSKKNIQSDCEASLRRLQSDYIDIFLLHWPARYTPQSNWGQSLAYHRDTEKYYAGFASFEDIVVSMGKLIDQGKIRGYGFCNDNAFGLTAAHYTAKALGVPPPVCLQNDFSLINRRIEENGVSEASSPIHCNSGFMAYNILAGGSLTGKYLQGEQGFRGRFDLPGWGTTLYRYQSGPAVKATAAYEALAKKYKMSLLEMALRFAKGRDAVTTSLLGSSNVAQLKQSLDLFRTVEPLPAALQCEIDRVHMCNRLPIFSSTGPSYGEYCDEGLIGERIP